jgi:predicted  nucleic acid-binding Zn-ribbon protein
MDSTITALKSTIASLRSTLKSLTIKQNTLKSTPTTAQLQDLVSSLQTSNAGKASKLSDLKNGNAKSYSKEEIKTVERHWKHWANARKARKVAYLALEDLVIPVLEERMGCSREEVRERLGIEIDD